MHFPIGAKSNKIRTFSALPQSDIFTAPCELCLNGEEIFHQRPAHMEVHILDKSHTAQHQKQPHTQRIIQLFMYKRIVESIPLKLSRPSCERARLAFDLW